MKKIIPPNQVRSLRKKEGLTQEQLAEKVGLTSVMVGYIERSQKGLSLKTAKKIARALNVHYTEILDGPDAGLAELTPDEKDLLNIFRTADDNEKKKIHALLQLYASDT